MITAKLLDSEGGKMLLIEVLFEVTAAANTGVDDKLGMGTR